MASEIEKVNVQVALTLEEYARKLKRQLAEMVYRLPVTHTIQTLL